MSRPVLGTYAASSPCNGSKTRQSGRLGVLSKTTQLLGTELSSQHSKLTEAVGMSEKGTSLAYMSYQADKMPPSALNFLRPLLK